MAASTDDFEGWLCEKLEKLDMDNEVFGNYIIGIMESEESTEDKNEALTDILGEISGSVEDVCKEICQQWNETRQHKLQEEDHQKLKNKVDTEAQMASIMEKHATTQEVKKELSAEDKERNAEKAALLARYAEVSESEEDTDDEDDGERRSKSSKANHKSDLLAPNMNAANVTKQVQEEREKNKQEYAKRRANEKLQREQQLQKTQDRKDKEKNRTQKQEKRR